MDKLPPVEVIRESNDGQKRMRCSRCSLLFKGRVERCPICDKGRKHD